MLLAELVLGEAGVDIDCPRRHRPRCLEGWSNDQVGTSRRNKILVKLLCFGGGKRASRGKRLLERRHSLSGANRKVWRSAARITGNDKELERGSQARPSQKHRGTLGTATLHNRPRLMLLETPSQCLEYRATRHHLVTTATSITHGGRLLGHSADALLFPLVVALSKRHNSSRRQLNAKLITRKIAPPSSAPSSVLVHFLFQATTLGILFLPSLYILHHIIVPIGLLVILPGS